MPSTGNTQGMRFKISPPINASTSVAPSVAAGGGADTPADGALAAVPAEDEAAGGDTADADEAAEANATSTRNPRMSGSPDHPFSDVTTPCRCVASAGPSGEIGAVKTRAPLPADCVVWGNSYA